MSQKKEWDKIDDLQLSSPGPKACLTPLSSKRQRIPSRKAAEAYSGPVESSPLRKSRPPRRKNRLEHETEPVNSSPLRNSSLPGDKLLRPSEFVESNPIRDLQSLWIEQVDADKWGINRIRGGQLTVSEEIVNNSPFNPFDPGWLAELDRIRAMADSTAPQPATATGTDDDPTRGLPYHDKATQDLKALLQKKRLLEKTIQTLDDEILKKETEYLEDTTHGNILTGFDNYIKGSLSTALGGGRRKTIVDDSYRVFSRSSRMNDSTDSPGLSSSHTTPSHAPTPINTSFMKEATSNNATPTSATSANKLGAGTKKAKKNGEDSETDSKDSKKIRTNFGASRK